jgi:hypothetical protein
MLEPCDGKLSRTVLRGERSREAPALPGKIMNNSNTYWANLQKLQSKSYCCGFCGDKVSSQLGLPLIFEQDFGGKIKNQIGGLYLCPNCSKFSEFINDENESQFPQPKYGNDVKNLPESIDHIYDEARKCLSLGCFTASVMICRKALMYLAVNQGDKPGRSFVEYINFLEAKGFLPPLGKEWVDKIRKKGNEANHEIVEANLEDAKNIVELLEMLLKFIYEYSQI